MTNARLKLMDLAIDDPKLQKQLDAWWKYFIVEVNNVTSVDPLLLDKTELGRETERQHRILRTVSAVGNEAAQNFAKITERQEALPGRRVMEIVHAKIIVVRQ